MADLRSTDFFTGQVHGTTAQNLWTVPTGHLDVIRSITVQNEGSSTNFVTIFLSTPATIFTINLAAIGGSGGNYVWNGRVAIAAATVVKYIGGNSNVTDVHAMGYRYFI